jgi:DNA polymerase III delta subunit
MAVGGGIYLLSGPDRVRKLRRVHELESALKIEPFDRHHVQAPEIGGAQLLALCRQQPAMSPVRFIVVDQAEKLDSAFIQAIRLHAAAIMQTACLIFVSESEPNSRQALWQLSPRSEAQDRSPALTVEQFPEQDRPAAKPFVFTEALGNRDVGRSLAAMRDQLMNGRESLELVGLLAWQLQRWVLMKRLMLAGMSIQQMVSVTGFRPWQIQRLQSEVTRRSLSSLQELLGACWRLDLDAKSGRTSPEIALEGLVVRICAAPSGA